MRNLKKILALALVFALAFAFTASAATFTDQATIGADYVDDVNMLVELGVISGYPDGSFGPQKNITRAEFTKMAYTLKYGADKDGALFANQACPFTDVANDSWAKGYINYCYNQKVVSGVGNNKFNPNGNITVAEASKMILVIMGCDPTKEGFIGSNWMANVVAKAIDLGVYDGWSGDPTSLATRELVAKLMRNAIFSPVYEYSAISGIGSQMDVLGQGYNPTLGEKTMGLYHIEGIVGANERIAIQTDDEGDILASGLEPTEDEEESIIFYTYKDADGDEFYNTISIDRGVADELVGCKVDVFFSADVKKDNDIITGYNNIEVIGDVILNSDTVVYETSAIAADVYPDGDSNSKTTVLPYIGFQTADGTTVKINVDRDAAGIEKLPKSVDAQELQGVAEAFGKYAYTYVADANSDTADLVYGAAGFLADMGYPTLAKYRFISVDGGKSFPYMIKTIVDTPLNANYGSIVNYSESKGTVTVSGVGTLDLDECTIDGALAIDDAVVYYRANGKLVIKKVEAVTGAVESFTDDGGVVVGGNTYYAWLGCEDVDPTETGLHDYYMENKNAQEAGTTYYVYENLIMEIDAEETAASVENYAVILRADYDANKDEAFVKLGFADNSEATYQIGKTYLKNSREPNDDANKGNRPQDFELNSYFGAVVKYKIMDNGRVDLSGQDFADEDFAANWKYDLDANDVQVVDSKFEFNGKTSYAFNDGTIIFALYGVPCYDGEGQIDAKADGYSPMRSRAYKLNELRDMKAKEIKALYIGNSKDATDKVVGSVVYNTNKGNAQYVVAGSMTVGDTLKSADIAYNETNALAYVVSAIQRYNNATDAYYAEFTLINENGLFTATTVENVQNTSTVDALNDDVIGNISNKGEGEGLYPAGSFVRFEKNADGVITTLDNEGLNKSDFMSTSSVDKVITADTQQGLFVVNVTNERNGILSFFNVTDAEIDPKNDATNSCKLSEDGYDIIGIDDDTYVGQILTKVSTRSSDAIAAFQGNAVVELEEGEIIRIFSFVDGYGA